jgi:hypothetical protein
MSTSDVTTVFGLQQLVSAFNARTDVTQCEYLTDAYWLEQQSPEVLEAIEAIDFAACSVLITPKGGADFSAIFALKAAGVLVTCGESDSFGWLTGVLHTQHGKIVYG